MKRLPSCFAASSGLTPDRVLVVRPASLFPPETSELQPAAAILGPNIQSPIEASSLAAGPVPATRRAFLKALGAGAVAATAGWSCATSNRGNPCTQPIQGSWISVAWDDRRHYYWNDA